MRLYETVGGTTTRMAYDGQNTIAEYNGSNAVQRRYVFGPGGEPLVRFEGSGTSTPVYYHADERGSVIALSDGDGAVTSVNAYDEYGIPAAGNVGRFQYTGQQWLAELDMYHYRARIYSPSHGRFLQTDPIGYAGGMNLRAYVGNDPVNLVDPTGLDGEEADGADCDAGLLYDASPQDNAFCQNVYVTGRRLRPRMQLPMSLAFFFFGGGSGMGIGNGGGAATPVVQNLTCRNGVTRMSYYRLPDGRTNIHVSAPISFRGPGAAASEQAYLASLNAGMSLDGQDYVVSSNFYMGSGGHVADVDASPGHWADGDVGGLGISLPNLQGASAVTRPRSLNSIIHEILHNMGLIDRFGPRVSWQDRQRYSQTIMGNGFTGRLTDLTASEMIPACQQNQGY